MTETTCFKLLKKSTKAAIHKALLLALDQANQNMIKAGAGPLDMQAMAHWSEEIRACRAAIDELKAAGL